jgi:pimeloyl-ACP methyl ester carboxylesterase
MKQHRPLLFALLLPACTATTGDSADTAQPPPFAHCSADAPSFGTVALTELSLHYACQGEAVEGEPTILMLHGFPEFWMGWADVMALLAPQHRVIAPDQRGYNTSDKPEALEDYELDHLVGDISELIDAIGGPVVLVGHDWGGAVAWAVAAEHPDQLERLVIANAPHMNVFADLLANDPAQQEAFGYLSLFMLDGTDELLVANDFGLLADMFEGVLSEEELAAYREAWGQDRAIEGGLNWYRANFEDGLPKGEAQLFVEVPTLVLWGMDDTALLPSNLEGLEAWVNDLSVQEVPGATHWIAHEVPETVAAAIEGFVPQ